MLFYSLSPEGLFREKINGEYNIRSLVEWFRSMLDAVRYSLHMGYATVAFMPHMSHDIREVCDL